jgi:hemerythrin
LGAYWLSARFADSDHLSTFFGKAAARGSIALRPFHPGTAMQLFQWDQTFETGSAVIDGQHQYMVEMINQFGELITRNASGTEEIELVCAKLIEYTNYHFAEEEQLMATAGLDQRHINQHCRQHKDLLNEIGPLRSLLVEGDMVAGKHLFEFLINWLVFHILGTDMLMARQIDDIQRGMTAEDAYSQEEVNNQQTTGVLLTAVKNLLYQLSNRNRALGELNETLEKKIQERTSALSRANEKLKELASTDSLTGVLNRRAFIESAKSVFDLADRYQRPLSMLMIDVDHFKRVNDNFGHQAGDIVLLRLCELIQKKLRGLDIIGRVGGEEFAVILPETGLEQTAQITERLLQSVREENIEIEQAATVSVTISIGVATVPPLVPDVDSAMMEADRALYQAKSSGRDRSCTAD